MVALAERLRLELDSSDRKNLVGSQIIPDKSCRPLARNGDRGDENHRLGVASNPRWGQSKKLGEIWKVSGFGTPRPKTGAARPGDLWFTAW